MFGRTILRLMVSLILAAAICHSTEQTLAEGIEPGDTVVTLYQTPVKVGEETLATLRPKTELLVKSVNGDWGAVVVQQEGKEVSGWVYAKHVRVVLDAPASSEYPIVLHIEECKKPGDPAKLYYSRRQAEKVLGMNLPKGGGGGFFMPGLPGLMLNVVQCKENPTVTGKLKGTLGIMPMGTEIPIVLKTLPKGFHGAALTGTKKGQSQQSQLSNWVVFEVK